MRILLRRAMTAEADLVWRASSVKETLGMAAQSRTLPAAKKAPGPLVGTLESRHSKNDGLSVGCPSDRMMSRWRK